MIQFGADGEATAKAEALRIAAQPHANWKSVVSLAPW